MPPLPPTPPACEEVPAAPSPPLFEEYEHAPLTDNDPDVTARVVGSFTSAMGPQIMIEPPKVLGSEDFSEIARGVGAPYCFWLFGGTDPQAYAAADSSDRGLGREGT